MEHGFSWFGWIPGLNHLPNHLVSATFVVILLIGLACLFYKRSRSEDKILPKERLGLTNFFESVGEFIIGMLEEIIGPKGRQFFPLIGTTFLFILFSNLMGVIPGFLPPTDNVNTNAACAVFIFLAYNYFGIKEHGWGYIKHFTGPLWWLAILFIPIEVISHLARPFALTLRLYGNIMGDHTVLSIFSDLAPIGVPVVFLALGVFVSCIQAFIFSILSVLYIQVAISHDH